MLNILVGAITALAYLTFTPPSAPEVLCANPHIPSNLIIATVTRVVDGDTIVVQISGDSSERVRLLGIDTPEVFDSEKLERDVRESGRSRDEIRGLGKLASEFAKGYLEGQEIGLEMDIQLRDSLGRSLAYVWLQNSALFNMIMLREGFAQTFTIPPNLKYADLFLACQGEARRQNKGLWGR